MAMESPLLRIIGAGKHAKVVLEIAERSNWAVIFLAEQAYVEAESYMGRPLKCLEQEVDRKSVAFHCAVGSIATRRKLYAKLIVHGWNPTDIIAETAYVSPTAVIGCGSFVGSNAVINPDAKIGKNCILNTASVIEHDCVIGDHVNISPNATLCGNVTVGSGTEVGAGATVLPGISIGRNSIVAAGAVVVNDVAEGTMVKGIPAK